MTRPAVALLPAQEGLEFNEAAHRYDIWSPAATNWFKINSVSQCLQLAGAKGFDRKFWRQSLVKNGLAPAEAEAYMDLHSSLRAGIGTDFHSLVRAELLSCHHQPQYAEALMMLARWRDTFLPHIQQVIQCEAPMASRALAFAGTPDLVALVNGLWTLVDWKTKASEEKAKPDPVWGLQLAGYAILLEEVHRIRIDRAVNVMIWTEGVKEVHWNRADLDQLEHRFIGHVAQSHGVQAADGSPFHAGALEHLLTLHPDALDRNKV
jgi:hypothetical protein